MQRRVSTETIIIGLEDRIEDFQELLENDSTMLESYNRIQYKDVDQLYALCQSYVEYYDRLKERE